ncbi:addiction module antidote protein [Niveispirillum sp. BGYR6]|uniref:addiction module antidote protein n=1 Tax=Niveispirillum sp. BGYR6 TaxID=2971249 RepID=UPI0022B9B6AE|nr:addiction module antidote protein [Niveispirillum sp. BGYR6]MDG5496553.1 putative addiction module antidote protein [Niveispirillum sp. BGYR6]
MTDQFTQTALFDPAEHLQTAEDIAAFLNAAAEEDDPAFMVRALGVAARAHGMMQLSRDTGVSREGLYKALGEEGNPTLSTLMAVAKALNLHLSFTPRS